MRVSYQRNVRKKMVGNPCPICKNNIVISYQVGEAIWGDTLNQYINETLLSMSDMPQYNIGVHTHSLSYCDHFDKCSNTSFPILHCS